MRKCIVVHIKAAELLPCGEGDAERDLVPRLRQAPPAPLATVRACSLSGEISSNIVQSVSSEKEVVFVVAGAT